MQQWELNTVGDKFDFRNTTILEKGHCRGDRGASSAGSGADRASGQSDSRIVSRSCRQTCERLAESPLDVTKFSIQFLIFSSGPSASPSASLILPSSSPLYDLLSVCLSLFLSRLCMSLSQCGVFADENVVPRRPNEPRGPTEETCEAKTRRASSGQSLFAASLFHAKISATTSNPKQTTN